MRPEAYVTPQHQLCAFAHWAHPRAERRRCQGSHRSWSLLQRMHKVLVVLHDTQCIQSALRQVRSVNQVLVHAREKPGWSCLDATGTMDTKHHLLDSLQALANWGLLQVQSSPAQGQSMLRLFTTRKLLDVSRCRPLLWPPPDRASAGSRKMLEPLALCRSLRVV